MPQSINTNVASLNAQRNLNRTQGTLSTALERLSTGLRINSAKDDAAGLAISERFTTQIRGLNQAVRNANDGISLAQTVEGRPWARSVNNLQRIRELAVQSANATNSASDRAALDAEAQQRIAEIDRIATQTSFNGTKVLDGTFGSALFQVGANVGETISVNLTTGLRSGQIGQIATATGQATTNALTAGGLTIAVGQGEAVSVGASDSNSAQDKVAAINAAGVPNLTATATTSVTGAFTNVTGGSATDTYSLTINTVDVFSNFDLTSETLDGSEVATQINLFASQTGVTAAFDSGNLTLTAADGRNIVAQEVFGAGGTGGIADAVAANGSDATTIGTVTLTAAENITLTGEFAELGLTNSIATDSSTLNDIDVLTVANANDTISRIDAALTTVSSQRSDLGAIQNRFESTIVNLETVSETCRLRADESSMPTLLQRRLH